MYLNKNQTIKHAMTIIFMAISLFTLPTSGTTQASEKLEITKAWLRATPPAAKAGGGYLVIANHTDKDEILTGVEFSGAKRSEVHEMKISDGVMSMRPLDEGLPIPAGHSVALKPGGYHLMFMGLKNRLEEGEEHTITLTFKNAGEITINFPVHSMDKGEKMMMQEN